MKPRILFISHSYPPIVGGVEIQNFDLAENLKKIAPTKIIANRKGKKYLPIFVPLAFFKALFLMTNYDICLVGNGILAPLAAILKFFHPKKKFFSVVHGLDVTYAEKEGFLPWIYKKINLPSLKKMHKLFMVGNHTILEAQKAGIDRSLCVFIPNGVDGGKFSKNYAREDLEKVIKEPLGDRKFILTSGRLVKRKGVAWFCENVMPQLDEKVIYLISGDGPDKENIASAIKKNGLEKRVRMLGFVSDEERNTLLKTCDIFVQPNIKVSGDMEGFGISVIEASFCKIIVIVSKLEGLKDAISDGKNGFLVEPENPEQWVKKINAVFLAGPDFSKNFGKMAAKFVEENFFWEKISKKYLEEMKNA